MVRQIVRLRWRKRLGPVQIGGRLAIPASTVHAVLVRCRINRLSNIDRVTGEPLRRYEHDHPGALIHVDVTKFGNIPDGGGWRYVGQLQGNRNRATTVARTGTPRSPSHGPLLGTCYLHTVIDDHSRVAYAEICADEKAVTAASVLQRAVAWFTDRGVNVERVLSDNGGCYRSFAWRDTCAALGITPKRTRPYRPQTNGKIERFHRTLADGWEYARWLGFAKIQWMVIHEARSEVTRRRDSGSPAQWLTGRKVLILGCGALGAPIAEHCVRAGVAQLHLVDKGVVTSGILVRQPYDDDGVEQMGVCDITQHGACLAHL